MKVPRKIVYMYGFAYTFALAALIMECFMFWRFMNGYTLMVSEPNIYIAFAEFMICAVSIVIMSYAMGRLIKYEVQRSLEKRGDEE